jgi:similar to spore coat protein
MASIIQNMAGMSEMTEQVIAADFLEASKSAIKNYALALTEATTPEVTNTLKRQLDDAINSHERITTYMMNKGYYNAYDPKAQMDMDRKASETVLNMNQPMK